MHEANNILITGASGLIGTHLTDLLRRRGDTVSHLGRSVKKGTIATFTWNIPDHTMDVQALASVDTIIHLAGAGVAEKRWTTSRKREILESRTQSTELLYNTLKASAHTVSTVIAASAIGYYGFERDEVFTEASRPGTDFLADVTRQWEERIDRIGALGIRVVKLRIGIVFSAAGGALQEMARPVKFFAGAPLGSGQQYVSWIHIEDLCAMFIKAIGDQTMMGPYNAVAPEPVTNRELTRSIATVLKRPLILPPVPGFVLKIILGEMGQIVLNGSRVSSQKIQRLGFSFKFNNLKAALEDCLVKK